MMPSRPKWSTCHTRHAGSPSAGAARNCHPAPPPLRVLLTSLTCICRRRRVREARPKVVHSRGYGGVFGGRCSSHPMVSPRSCPMNHNLKHSNMCIRTLHQSIASSIFVQLAFEAIGVFQRPGEGAENVGFHKDSGPKTHSPEFSGLRMRDGEARLGFVTVKSLAACANTCCGSPELFT